MRLKSVAPMIKYCIFGFLICSFSLLQAQTKSENIASKFKLKYDGGIEYMHPYNKSRLIQTVSTNQLIGVERFEKTHLSLYVGLTATYAWGNIVQYTTNFKDTTYQNKAFGIGPVFLLRFEPIIYRCFSISCDFGGGFILYSQRFPYGGDVYNFMWRFGGSLLYRIDQKNAVSLSGKWMHVSNGQGFNEKNPSYEATGASIQYTRYF